MAIERLSDSQIQVALKSVPEWSESGGSVQRTFKFKDFVESMKFVERVAQAAEHAQHHPDIMIRWNKVTLTLSTHDAGGITQRDFDLAAACDTFAALMGVPASPAEATPSSPAPTAAPPSGAAAPEGKPKDTRRSAKKV